MLLKRMFVLSIGVLAIALLVPMVLADDPPGPDPVPIPDPPDIDDPDFPDPEPEDWVIAKCCIPGGWSTYWPGLCEPTTCRSNTPCGGTHCAVWVNGVCLDSPTIPPPTCAIVSTTTSPPQFSCTAQICKVWRQDAQGVWYIFEGVTCKLTPSGSCAQTPVVNCQGHPC